MVWTSVMDSLGLNGRLSYNEGIMYCQFWICVLVIYCFIKAFEQNKDESTEILGWEFWLLDDLVSAVKDRHDLVLSVLRRLLSHYRTLCTWCRLAQHFSEDLGKKTFLSAQERLWIFESSAWVISVDAYPFSNRSQWTECLRGTLS